MIEINFKLLFSSLLSFIPIIPLFIGLFGFDWSFGSTAANVIFVFFAVLFPVVAAHITFFQNQDLNQQKKLNNNVDKTPTSKSKTKLFFGLLFSWVPFVIITITLFGFDWSFGNKIADALFIFTTFLLPPVGLIIAFMQDRGILQEKEKSTEQGQSKEIVMDDNKVLDQTAAQGVSIETNSAAGQGSQAGNLMGQTSLDETVASASTKDNVTLPIVDTSSYINADAQQSGANKTAALSNDVKDTLLQPNPAVYDASSASATQSTEGLRESPQNK